EEGRQTDAVTVFHCAFGDNWDINYDAWPDHWVRKTGMGFPQYVEIAIQKDATAVGHKALQIDLDGASAAVVSPPIRVMSRFSYVFEAQLKNVGLQYSRVTIVLDFCDSAGRVLQTAKTDPFSTTKGWQSIQLGPVEPSDPSIDHVTIGLQALQGHKGDLHGHVSLANVTLKRLPRIDVTTNNSCNVYTSLDGVEIKCTLSGIREPDPEIDFQLLDGTNRALQKEHFRLNGRAIADGAPRGAGATEVGVGPAGYEGTIHWHPKIPDYGFYHVVVLMKSAVASGGVRMNTERQLGSRNVDLVVVPKLPMPRHGEFGWSLPEGDRPLPFQDLSRLLPEVGINWVKVPLWFDATSPRRGDELIRFVELLGASNIDVVGIIDRPPNQLQSGNALHHPTSIADLLSQTSSTWVAALEPVMTRLSLRVRWWQLGSDYDTSYSGLKALNKHIADLRTALFRFGQDVRIGMCWDWSNSNAQTGNVRWDFEQLCSEKEPTATKWEKLLSMPPSNSAQRWVIIEPPPRPTGTAENSEAAFQARATEFVHRLIAAKVHGAEAIFVSKPFDDDNGLMRADGMPADLLLPWRTTAAMLGGAKYLGEMQLPFGSDNRVFMRGDGQVVMVVWNAAPTREILYLGEHVQQFDLLGRATPAKLQGHEQMIEVGPTPTFVLGLHPAVTQWRMSTHFEKRQIPSISKRQHNSLQFTNFFPQGVGGTVKVFVLQDRGSGEYTTDQEMVPTTGFAPDRWTIEPSQGNFQLAANAKMKFPFDVQLKSALYGKKPVRIDFTVEADEKIEFSVYREMEVGTEDLTLDVKSHLDKEGTLVVEQTMTNKAPHLADFKCSLWAYGHRPQRMQVYRLGKTPDRKVYRISNGRELLGKELWLDLEELNGPRILKYRIVATAESASDADPSKKKDSSDATKTNQGAPSTGGAKRPPLATDRS
ncbi:MAG TPA: hypothetical protein VHE81_02845, partial [Lacipirellulaceae bacterium]|nr:hypothetical protein [Lacipirellulaceae bacterium]